MKFTPQLRHQVVDAWRKTRSGKSQREFLSEMSAKGIRISDRTLRAWDAAIPSTEATPDAVRRAVEEALEVVARVHAQLLALQEGTVAPVSNAQSAPVPAPSTDGMLRFL